MKIKDISIMVACIIIISTTTNGLFTDDAVAGPLAGPVPSPVEDIIGEVGKITLTNTIDAGHYATVTFQHQYKAPVVVAFIMTRNGEEASIDARVRNVQSGSCEIFMQKPGGGSHPAEDVSYMVMEKGVHTITDYLSDGWGPDKLGQGILVEAGTVTTSEVHRDGFSFSELGERVYYSDVFVNYRRNSDHPVLLHTLNTHNNGQFMSTSVSHSTLHTNFWIRQEAAGSGSPAVFEEIGWIAIEDTSYAHLNSDWPFKRFVARTIDIADNFGVDDDRAHTFSHSFFDFYDNEDHIVIAKGTSTLNLQDDLDGYWIRAAHQSQIFRTRFYFYAEEDQVGDMERSHGGERVSYLVVSGPTVFKQIDSDGDGLSDLFELFRTQETTTHTFWFEEGKDYSSGGGVLPPIGGCPYVSVWNGTGYQHDNNILIASEHQEGVVDDNYILRNTMVPKDGFYSLKIEEFEFTEDFFDTFSLYTIDHREGYSVGTTPDGEYRTFKDPVPPESAYDCTGSDVLEYVSAPDGNSLFMEENTTIVLNYGDVGNALWEHQKLVVRSYGFESYTEPSTQGADIGPMFLQPWDPVKTSLYISIRADGSDWTNVTVLHPRNHPSDMVIPLGDVLQQFVQGGIGELEVKIFSTQNHSVDFVGLDNSVPTPVKVQKAPMVSAMLNGAEDVTDILLEGNDEFVTIVPGEHIILTFEIPEQNPAPVFSVRDYMLYSKGYYVLYENISMSYNLLFSNNNIMSTEMGPYHEQKWRKNDIQVPGFVQQVELTACMRSEASGQFMIILTVFGAGDEFTETIDLTSSHTTKTFTKNYFEEFPMGKYNDAHDWRLTVKSIGSENIGVYVQNVKLEFTHSLLSPFNPDMDGDGLTDGDELLIYGTDPLNPDTDGDGLSDYDEIYVYGTDPLNPDTDGDGLSDYDEIYVHGTNPLNPDTDGDGLSDYDELFVHGTCPLNPDTSGDGVIDGNAVHGYTVPYFSYCDDDGMTQHERHINNADPHKAYKNLDGSWRNTDLDGIPDVFEADPGNIHDPKFDGMDWVESMRRFEGRFNNSNCEDEQNFFDNATNPFVKYQGVPIVDRLTVNQHWKTDGGYYAVVVIHLYDPSGVESIYLATPRESVTFSITPNDVGSDGLIRKAVHLNINTDDRVSGWDLELETTNGAGNIFSRTRYVKGALDVLLDFGNWIWDLIKGAITSVAAAVTEMVNALVGWVENAISTMFSAVINPIIEGLQNWANGIEYHMTQFFSELAKWDTLDGDESVSATMNAGSAFMLSFMGQQDKAEQITDVMMYVMNFVKPFQKYISPFGAISILTEWVGATSSYVGDVLDYVENLFRSTISATTKMILGFFDGIIDIDMDFNIDLPTIDGLKNFYNVAGITNSLIDGIICGVGDYFNTDGTDNIILECLSIGLIAISFTQALSIGLNDGTAQALYATNIGLSLLTQILITFSGWSLESQVIMMTAVSIPLLLLGLIFYGMKITISGTTPVELGLVGACTLIDTIIYATTINKGA